MVAGGLDRGLLRLPDREIPMGSRLSRLLGDVCDHRKDPAQDRVLLTPGTGKPMDLARLSTVIRTALIRGGLEQLSLGDLSRLSRRGSQRQTVLARLSAVGSLTREEVMDLLGVSKSAALKLLNQLRQDGAVVRIGGCYYPAGAVVLPEDQSAAVTAYLAAHGTAVRKELAELLNLPPAQCTALLRRMADQGRAPPHRQAVRPAAPGKSPLKRTEYCHGCKQQKVRKSRYFRAFYICITNRANLFTSRPGAVTLGLRNRTAGKLPPSSVLGVGS